MADTLATVMKLDPDWSALPQDAPTSIHKLVRRCLTKDRKQRLQAIGEARIVLENPGGTEVSRPAKARPTKLPWAVTAIVSVLAVALGFLAYRHVTEETRVLKLSVQPPERATVVFNSVPAVSPDGRRLAFTATVDGKPSLWVRDLDSLAARPLAGTEGASGPFWSPDSRFIAFVAGGKLKNIDVAGGPSLTLCDASTIRGGSWSKDGVIVFTPTLTSGLFRVPAAGGSPTAVTFRRPQSIWN